MPRTTIDLDAAVLRALKRRQRKEGKTMGRIASELLAQALASDVAPTPPFRWIARPMGALVDLDDKDAVWRTLDAP
jgi:hypothetical protein